MANFNYHEEVIQCSATYPTLLRARNHPLRPSSPNFHVFVAVNDTALLSEIDTGLARDPGMATRRPTTPSTHPWSASHYDIEDMLELGSGNASFLRQPKEDRPEQDVLLFHL